MTQNHIALISLAVLVVIMVFVFRKLENARKKRDAQIHEAFDKLINSLKGLKSTLAKETSNTERDDREKS